MAGEHHRKRRRKKKRMSKLRRQRRRILLCLGFLCLAIVFGVSYGVLYHYVNGFPKEKICDNIYIGAVNVSGMSEAEAKNELMEHLKEDQALTLTMQVDKKSQEASLEEMGLGYQDLDKTVQKAVNYGKKGSLWKRYRQLKKLKKEKVVFDESFVLDEEKAGTVINERIIPLANHAVDASIEKNSTGFKIKEEKEGKTVNIEASIQEIEKVLNTSWKHESLTVEMVQKKEKPKVVSADLETIQDELGAFSTDAGGGERWQNLKTGVEHLNGTVLMPGEELSVHDKTAPYDAEHGYVEAGSYENGQVVDSFGGGICQVSTTLYNAVLYAELEVVERYPHSMLVNYVEPSRDAAIAGDYLDFVFRNNYDTPIYIEGEIDSANQLRFCIYGKDTRDAGRSVEFESETLETEDYGITYEEDPEASLGSMQYAGSPHTGKTAQLWKIVYQDGEEVSRDVINSSKYEKSDQIIKIGTASENSQASALVRSAIATQDQAKINEAISQASQY